GGTQLLTGDVRMTSRLVVLGLAFLPVLAQAQAAPVATPVAQQITAAVLPLPQEFRADARVLGYQTGRRGLVPLRAGKGAFTCLAADPAAQDLPGAWYHQALAP